MWQGLSHIFINQRRWYFLNQLLLDPTGYSAILETLHSDVLFFIQTHVPRLYGFIYKFSWHLVRKLHSEKWNAGGIDSMGTLKKGLSHAVCVPRELECSTLGSFNKGVASVGAAREKWANHLSTQGSSSPSGVIITAACELRHNSFLTLTHVRVANQRTETWARTRCIQNNAFCYCAVRSFSPSH